MIGGVLRNSNGEVLLFFSKNVGVKESNEDKVLVILEALQLFSHHLLAKLIVESDSTNAVMWASHFNSRPRRFQFLFNEIIELSSSLDVCFCHVIRSADSFLGRWSS